VRPLLSELAVISDEGGHFCAKSIIAAISEAYIIRTGTGSTCPPGSPAKDVGWRRKVENKSKKEKINRKGKK
jgi:hypothetical protein